MESDDADGFNRTARGGRNGAGKTKQILSTVHVYSLIRAGFSW